MSVDKWLALQDVRRLYPARYHALAEKYTPYIFHLQVLSAEQHAIRNKWTDHVTDAEIDLASQVTWAEIEGLE